MIYGIARPKDMLNAVYEEGMFGKYLLIFRIIIRQTDEGKDMNKYYWKLQLYGPST